MFEQFAVLFSWLETNADFLGAVGTIFAVTTLFITNGSLILKRIFGIGADVMPSSLPDLSAAEHIPNYGDLPAIACLPLRQSGLNDDHFAEAVWDDIISLVQRDKDIAAAPRTSMLKYSQTIEDIRLIAKAVGCSYVLEGSLRQSNGNIRLNMQLLDNKGLTLWSDRMDITAAYDHDTQEALARFVADGICATLMPDRDAKYDGGHHGEKALMDVAAVTQRMADGAKAAHAKLNPHVAQVAGDIAAHTGLIAEHPDTGSTKLRGVAIILCMLGFLGLGGIHRFYVGRKWTGLLYLFTGGLFYIGTILDLIVLLTGCFGCAGGHPVSYWTARERKRALALEDGNITLEH